MRRENGDQSKKNKDHSFRSARYLTNTVALYARNEHIQFFSGKWFITGRAYGIVAFLLTWIEHLSKGFPVYICAVVLTAASVVTAIIAINKDKNNDKEA